MFSKVFYITHLTGSIYTETKISLNFEPFRTLQRVSCVDGLNATILRHYKKICSD